MKVSVFIADDHAIIRDGLGALLAANSDIDVIGEAANGIQAVERVIELNPDVVIMDISMPELNGISATRLILEKLPGVNVIILSMLGTSKHVYEALEAGARGYLLKESAGREVMEAVLAVHAGDVYLSQPVTNILVSDYLQHRGEIRETSLLDRLSQREREILPLVVQGKTSAEIAALLFLSPKTVESYRSRMMHKLEVEDLPSLVRLALEEGLLP